MIHRSSNLTVTIDFHNTLFQCDDWFELEVRELVSAFLIWRARARGTRLPSETLLTEARDAYRALRHQITATGIERTASESLSIVLPQLGISVSRQEIEEGVDVLMLSTFNDAVQPMPGAIDFITYLSSLGVHLGIISIAIYHPFLEWSLQWAGIDRYFDAVVSSAAVGHTKSSTELYYHAARALQVDPERIVHVGDSSRFDIGGAQAAGFSTVWIQGDRPVDDEYHPDLTLPSLINAGRPVFELARSIAAGQTDA